MKTVAQNGNETYKCTSGKIFNGIEKTVQPIVTINSEFHLRLHLPFPPQRSIHLGAAHWQHRQPGQIQCKLDPNKAVQADLRG